MKTKILQYTLAPIIFLLFWFLISISPFIPQVLVPSPLKVIGYLFTNFHLSLLYPTLFTLNLWISGFLAGATIGIILGLIIGYNQKLYNYLEVIIDFFRSLPAIVLLPIIVIFLGIGYAPKFFIIIFFTALYIMVNTVYGVVYGKTSKILLSKVLKMTSIQRFVNVIFPSALPSIFVGLRTTISLSLIVAIASEMLIGGSSGLGRKIMDDMLVYNMTEMYSIILVIGLLGYFSNKLFYLFENKIIHWKGF